MTRREVIPAQKSARKPTALLSILTRGCEKRWNNDTEQDGKTDTSSLHSLLQAEGPLI